MVREAQNYETIPYSRDDKFCEWEWSSAGENAKQRTQCINVEFYFLYTMLWIFGSSLSGDIELLHS